MEKYVYPPTYGITLLSRASFFAALETDGIPCLVEVTVYRLNAVASISFSLDGPDSVLQCLNLNASNTSITRHEKGDIITVVHVNSKDTITSDENMKGQRPIP